jgi:uncharacterized protein (TIGR03492 family)
VQQRSFLSPPTEEPHDAIGRKAAPRFELGIKDLQSSALPLGHAAIRGAALPSADRISEGAGTPPGSGSLLVLSNGHGEDLIALRILEALHRLCPGLRLRVLPMVGTGATFTAAEQAGWIERVGPPAELPSGGFSNQSLRGLLADLSSGLALLSWRQWRCLRRERKRVDAVLAVGDLLPLLMAWGAGRPFGFVGTPKSDYTWRSGPGRSPSDRYHRLKGSEWDPWEWLLMRSRRCRLVAMRDRITARGLQRHRVRAEAPGNPMMDGFRATPVPAALERCRRILLLCGSRMPEALRNAERLLQALEGWPSPVPIALLMATGSQPEQQPLAALVTRLGYRPCPPPADALGASACWVNGVQLLLLGRGRFQDWASWAEVGLATAGTATEQLVGLGVPSLSLPGPGPQFTRAFATRQSRLLGGAVRSCRNAADLRQHLAALLESARLREELGRVGRQRMGPPGGSAALAQRIQQQLITDTERSPSARHGRDSGP